MANKIMDVFQAYKPIRNKIARLAMDDALGVTWAYCQYLQTNDFVFPKEIEILDQFLRLKTPQTWIAEWELEILVKEIIINSGTVSDKNLSLRRWKTISDITNSFKNLENDIYGSVKKTQSILVELIRIAHRQFNWQSNSPNAASIIRNFKMFNRKGIDEICLRKTGLNVWEVYMCGVALMGHFLDRPEFKLPLSSEIVGLSAKKFEKFLEFTSRPVATIKADLKAQQQYNKNFPYAYNSLRAYPIVQMQYKGAVSLVCPMMTLLFWRFTSGLYYELIGDPQFGNEFGEGFQSYVGEVIRRAMACADATFVGEQKYKVGRQEKRTIDWIVEKGDASLFIECKSMRISWGAKMAFTDLTPLDRQIEGMAGAVVQVYKAIDDYKLGRYPNYEFVKLKKIFPIVVTPENWRMFGPIMVDKLAKAVSEKLQQKGLAASIVLEMPYAVMAAEELEVALQIINSIGVLDFMQGKLGDAEMSGWDWHAYMVKRFSGAISDQMLFDKDYDDMFAPLLSAQFAN